MKYKVIRFWEDGEEDFIGYVNSREEGNRLIKADQESLDSFSAPLCSYKMMTNYDPKPLRVPGQRSQS